MQMCAPIFKWTVFVVNATAGWQQTTDNRQKKNNISIESTEWNEAHKGYAQNIYQINFRTQLNNATHGLVHIIRTMYAYAINIMFFFSSVLGPLVKSVESRLHSFTCAFWATKILSLSSAYSIYHCCCCCQCRTSNIHYPRVDVAEMSSFRAKPGRRRTQEKNVMSPVRFIFSSTFECSRFYLSLLSFLS